MKLKPAVASKGPQEYCYAILNRYRETNHVELPSFSSTFLSEITESLKKRRKAIKYSVVTPSWQKVLVEGEDRKAKEEKLEIEFPGSARTGRDPKYCFYFWEDRWCLIDGRQSSKNGWVWEQRIEGQLLPMASGREIVTRIELAYHHFQEFALAIGNTTLNLESIWQPIIAAEPKLVHD